MPTKKKSAAAPAAPERPEMIEIPPAVVEALLYSEATSNRAAVKDVCNQIREIAEKQGFVEF